MNYVFILNMKVPKKPSGRKRSPFYWWRRFRTHKMKPWNASPLARIKNEGKPLGNLTNLDVVRVRGHATIKANADKYAKDIKDIIEGIKLSGVNTLQGIATALNNRGVKTYNDKVWYPTTIKNVMERALQ